MNTYIATGFKSVKSETMKDAAQIFAERMARKKFGKNFACRTLNIEAYAQDGSFAEFSAFIGKTKGNETVGHNVSFTVYAS